MALPPLEFPNLNDTACLDVWRAVKAILKADPNLATVRRMRLWEGEVDDAAPPTESQMPWLRVTPLGTSPVRRFDEASWEVDLTYKYELAVQGTNVEDLILFTDALRGALKFDAPVGDSTVMAVLRDTGATTHDFRTAAMGPLRLRDVDPDNNTIVPTRNLASAGLFVVRAIVPAIS
jgi:hypothetical protein